MVLFYLVSQSYSSEYVQYQVPGPSKWNRTIIYIVNHTITPVFTFQWLVKMAAKGPTMKTISFEDEEPA